MTFFFFFLQRNAIFPKNPAKFGLLSRQETDKFPARIGNRNLSKRLPKQRFNLRNNKGTLTCLKTNCETIFFHKISDTIRNLSITKREIKKAHIHFSMNSSGVGVANKFKLNDEQK